MKELKEMVSLVGRQGIKKLDILTPSNRNGRMFELFELVRKGQVKTDDEAISKIYGEDLNKAAYTKLKNRLHNQLLNTILFADTTPGVSNSSVVANSSYRLLASFKILIGISGHQSAYALGKRILKKSIRYELTEQSVIVLSSLRQLAARMGDKKKFNHYNNLLHKYQKLHFAELRANEFQESIVIHYARSRSAQRELALKAKEYSKELKKYTDVMDSHKLHQSAFIVFSLTHEIAGEYDKLREVCEEAVAYFENKKPLKRNTVFVFLFKSLGYYKKVKDFENGEKTIKRAIEYILFKDSRNYFITIEQYITLAFLCKKYKVAYEQYYAAIGKKGFDLMLDNHKEHWKIYGAYLEFLKLTGKLEIEDGKQRAKFKLGKFINELPTFSKDKMGFNAAILIIQFLLLLQMKKNEELIDRAESLRIYAYRYLRKPETMRSFYFVKMLIEIVNAKFHKEAVIRKSEKYYKKMVAMNASGLSTYSITEIITYEDLWTIILNLLESKIYKNKQRLTTKK